MAIVKVIEVLAESPKSWEDAAEQAIKQASKSLHGIRGLYIKEQSLKIEDNKIVEYRITAKISFVLD